MQAHQQFNVDIERQAWNFVKNETLAQVFFCGFYEFFNSPILLKARLQRNCFLVNFEKIFTLYLFKK